MRISYKTRKLEKQFSSAKEISKNFGVNAKRVSQRKAELESADNLEILMQIPAANCHPLKGDRDGEWALDVSKNHRIIFEIDHDPIPTKETGSIDAVKITDVIIINVNEDYH